MKLKYVVFLLDTQREVYGNEVYYVLGECIKAFDTQDEAVKHIETLNIKGANFYTVIPIYSGK
jgi:hypothetical protein